MAPVTPEEMIRMIYTICDDVAVRYSGYTDGFYVSTHLEIGKGGILTGIAEHRSSIDTAIRAYWNRLTELDSGEKIVANAMSDKRAEYRWNGSVFCKIS